DFNMADQAGLFVANSPSIKPSIPFMENHEGKSLITLHNDDCRSVSFYENLEKWLKDGLNYVVMCTGDDELNISLAVRIFRLAMSYRPNMEHFVILVHIANDSDGHIAGIANHYNRLWAAERVTTKKNSNHQKIVRIDELPESPIIRLFGLTQSTYTYKNIIDEDIVAQAKDFKAQYDESIKALERRWGVKEGEVQTWDEEFADLMQLTDEYRGYSPTYSALMRLRRVQQQNIANCLHKKTKEHLAEVALGEKYKVFREHQLFRRINHINYEWKENVEPKSGVTRVLDVLAQTEHLRWNASHEILRYREIADENDKDEVRMLHGCLKKWQDLSTEKQSYDYNVVDVTLGIVEG
ncbi:MAG: hypothetical protein IK092_00420, partial [Muribaculaceae bacterium]|nr:hypothetical protein [Muribaculaceae bacterium]